MSEADDGVQVFEAEVVPPTKAEAEYLAELHARFLHDEVSTARRNAYATETDPMAFKVLRGEATAEDYAAAVQAVRDRFPYPEP